jgi:fused signal recognition particle receptor
VKFNLGERLGRIFGAKKEKSEILGEIEELLISSDFGVEFTMEILQELERRLPGRQSDPDASGVSAALLREVVKEKMETARNTAPERAPGSDVSASFRSSGDGGGLTAHLVFGVNGSGKTTSVAKLAYKLKKQGRMVLIAAADTYRDAAIDQLMIWSSRADVPVVRQFQGSDAAAVVYDACDASISRGVNDLVIDTAGRLHNKDMLMRELAKIGAVLDRKLPDSRKLRLLILDATTGQNALSQASLFRQYVGVDGIILTKLDSSAKGGIACAVSGKLGIPILYAGTGEKVQDLIDFDTGAYLEMLFS